MEVGRRTRSKSVGGLASKTSEDNSSRSSSKTSEDNSSRSSSKTSEETSSDTSVDPSKTSQEISPSKTPIRGLGIAAASHSISKSNIQAKSRKPIVEKWTVSTSSSSTSTSQQVAAAKEHVVKNQALARMGDTFIISEGEPKIGQQVKVMSDGNISRGKVIKTCPVGYLVHYDGWSVMFDEWIKTFKSSKAIPASELVENGNSGAKPKKHLTGRPKEIKVIEIEDDTAASVQSSSGNNNSPVPAPKARPSKSQSQIQQLPNATNKPAPEKGAPTQQTKTQKRAPFQEKRASLPQAGNQTKKEHVQATPSLEKISIPQEKELDVGRTEQKTPTPQPRTRTPVQRTKNKDKKFLDQEARNQEVTGPIPMPRTNSHEKLAPIPQPRNLTSNLKVQESKNTIANKKSHESPKVLPRKVYTTNGTENVSNGNAVSKAKGNIWITNKDLENKNVFKNAKHETSGSGNKNGAKNIPSKNNDNNGRSSSLSFGQGQSKINQGLGVSKPLVFSKTKQFETVDSTDDDDDLTCNYSPTCMGSFWYMSELHSHLKTSHGIQDPESFCKRAREKKFAKESNEKEPKQEDENRPIPNHDQIAKSRPIPNHDNGMKSRTFPNPDPTMNGDVSINLISPENQTTKSKSLSYTKVVSSKETISEYEQIRENNIKERLDMFEKLGIKETKDVLTPNMQKSKTMRKKSTPSNKTKSVKRVLSSSETEDSDFVRKSSRLKSKPDLNYSDMNDPESNSDMTEPDSNSDMTEPDSFSDSDSKDSLWIEKEVETPKKKPKHSSPPQDIWIVKEIETPKKPITDPLKDIAPASNKGLLPKDERKDMKNSSFKSVKPQEQPKKQENSKNINNVKNLSRKLSTTEDIDKEEDSEEGGYTCNIDGCLESFWYENQLFEHMAYTHD